MNKALLDTDIFSELGKGMNAAVVRNGISYRNAFGFYTLSAVTVMEVVRGYQQKQLTGRIQAFMASLSAEEVIGLDAATAELAGRIAGDLERTGQRIGVSDSIIAAIALQHGLELVTGNTAHYRRVQGLGYPLVLGNWRA